MTVEEEKLGSSEAKELAMEKDGGKKNINKLMKSYATGDQKLNQHIFGNLKLLSLDFSSPEIYALFKGPKRPQGK